MHYGTTLSGCEDESVRRGIVPEVLAKPIREKARDGDNPGPSLSWSVQ